MLLNALLHLKSAQHVSGTYMTIIRSSRLYCVIAACGVYCLGCWWSDVRSRAAGYASRTHSRSAFIQVEDNIEHLFQF